MTHAPEARILPTTTARSVPRYATALLTLSVLACSGAPAERAPSAHQVAVAVAPDSASLAPLAQQALAATVSGTIDQSVTWAVVEGTAGGTVTASGAYTAPSGAGNYHVVVTSVSDPTKSAFTSSGPTER